MQAQINNKLVWAILLGTVCVKIASCMSVPFLAIYLTKQHHISLAMAGLIVGILPLTYLIGGFVGGYLADRFGRIKLLQLSLLGSGASFLLWFIAADNAVNTVTLILYFLFSAANGFFTSLFPPISQALLSDLLPAEQRNKFFHLRYTAINIGSIIGPLIGVWVGLLASASTFLITSLTYFAYFILFAVLLKNHSMQTSPTAVKQHSFIAAVKVLIIDNKLKYFVVSGILINICVAQSEAVLSQYIALLFADSATVFSYLLAVGCATFIVCQAPVYFITKNIQPVYSIMIGIVLLIVGLFIFAIAHHHISLFFIAMIITAISELFVFPVSSYFLDSIAPDSLKGIYFGAGMLRQLGFSIGPILGSYILVHFGGSLLFLFTMIIALIAGLLQLYILAKPVLCQHNCNKGFIN